MIRQERRRLTRAIDKEVKWIWQKSQLTKIMKSKPFNSLTAEDMEQLEKGEFPYPEVQKDYNTVKDLMLRLQELKEKRETINKGEILERFVSKLVNNSKDIDPEYAQIVNENYRDLLW